MKKISTIVWSALIGVAVQTQAGVLTLLDGSGADPSSTTVTWTNFGGSVTATATDTSDPSIDAAQNTVTDSRVTGVLTMDVVALHNYTTTGVSVPFDPGSWTGGDAANGKIHTLSSGWGVAHVDYSSGNGNLNSGEALICTIDRGSLNMAPGSVLRLLAIDFNSAAGQLWKKEVDGGATNGVLIASGDSAGEALLSLDVADGDTFAVVSGGSGAVRLSSITFDVLAKPITVDTPTGLGAVAADTVALLDWDDDITGFLDTYTVYRGTASGTNNYTFTTNVTDSSFTDTALINGSDYYYAVTATDTNGLESAFSDEVSVQPFEASTNIVLIQNLDASDAGSVTLTNGNEVIGWADLSGNGNDAVEGSSGGPVFWPSASLSASGLAGMDVTTNSAQLDILSDADAKSFLDFTGAAISNNGFCVMIAFKADTVKQDVAHQIVLANDGNFDDLTLRLESNGDLEARLDGVTVTSDAGVADGDTIVMALNYKANTGLMEFWDSKTGSLGTGTAAIYGDFSSDSGTPVSVGTSGSATRFLDGMIGEVKVFSSYLDAATFEAERDDLVSQWGSATSDKYTPWAESFGLTNAVLAAFDNDLEPDGLNNLMEYALGGNPTNDDAAAVLPVFSTVLDGGTNWFYHIHNERDDNQLTYTVDLKSDLVLDPAWTNSGIELVGQSGFVGDFKSVTNRTDVGVAEFIRLKVEK